MSAGAIDREDAEAFGSTLRKLRKESGLSLRAAAGRIGVSASTLHEWEMGNGLDTTLLLHSLVELYGVRYAVKRVRKVEQATP